VSLISTPAIVLRTYRYSETSKIVRLATRDYGVQSAIAKGVLRPRSPFGAALETLSEGVAQMYHKETRELQTLAAFDVVQLRRDLAGDVGRFAGAAALSEVMLKMAPPAPLPVASDPHATPMLDAMPIARAVASHACACIRPRFPAGKDTAFFRDARRRRSTSPWGRLFAIHHFDVVSDGRRDAAHRDGIFLSGLRGPPLWIETDCVARAVVCPELCDHDRERRAVGHDGDLSRAEVDAVALNRPTRHVDRALSRSCHGLEGKGAR
jgi:hypothetical protein